MTKEEIGRIFKRKRKSLEMTQEVLAEKTEIHEKQISRIESGKHYPTLENFIKLMAALNMKFADFDEDVRRLIPAKSELHAIVRDATGKEVKLYLEVVKAVKNNWF